MKRPHARILVALSPALILAGCALGDPYIRPSADNMKYVEACRTNCSIDQAQQYSRVVREAYRDRMSSYAKLRHNSGAANIVLGAMALGLAQGRVHRDNFIGFGLAGGTTYGLALWYGNEKLEALYASAYHALVCAENAVEPLRIATQLEGRLTSGIAQFEGAYVPAAQALAAFNVVVLELRATEQSPVFPQTASRTQAAVTKREADEANALIAERVAQGSSELASAQLRLTTVSESYTKATQLQQASGTAGNRLVRVVDRIVATVDKQVQAALPDPDASQLIIANLGALASKVVPGLELRMLTDANDEPVTGPQSANVDSHVMLAANRLLAQRFDQTLAQLKAALAALEVADVQMSAVVKSVPIADIATALSACDVEASAPLSATPSTLTLTGTTMTTRFFVSGGKAPYSGVVLGEQLTGLALENPLVTDRGFRLTRTAATPAGTARLAISDAAGNVIEIPVTISAAPQAAAPPAGRADGDGGAAVQRQQAAQGGPFASFASADELRAAMHAALVGKRLSENAHALGYAFTVDSIELDEPTRTMRIKLKPTPGDAFQASSLKQAVLNRELGGNQTIAQALAAQLLTLHLS